MTNISPLLQNKISTTGSSKNSNLNNRHEKLYLDLQKRANEVKPNEAKARLVEEGILGNPITEVKDMVKDGKNFVTAVKTGKMGDNNLGRINDLGLKFGAAIIATFLAFHSKTKTESLMRFIGGATFIGMMDLWPKLFINLPAKLVHGFRIDRKYISAQGDKKDFFLDNQFLVWDAYPEAQLRQDAQNAGIDYDSKNGKEKIQRKMQKTALQNRTLWMATAGFATPLLTAMIGNFVEPKVKELVVNKNVQNTKNMLYDLDGYLDGTVQKPTISQKLSQTKLGQKVKGSTLVQKATQDKSLAEIDKLFESYNGGKIDEKSFFSKLGELLNPADYLEKYKDIDDKTPLKKWTPSNLTGELQKIQKGFRKFDKDSLFAQFEAEAKNANRFSLVDYDAIKVAIGEDFSLGHVEQVLEKNNVGQAVRERILENSKKFDDNQGFQNFIKKLSTEFVAPLRAKSKAYLDLMNPILGSKSESAFTMEFSKTMNSVLKTLGLDDYKTLKALRSAHTDQMGEQGKTVLDMVSSSIQKLVKETSSDDDKYKAFIQSLCADFSDKGVENVALKLANAENIGKIMPQVDEIDGVSIRGIVNAFNGATQKPYISSVRKYIEEKGIRNIDVDKVLETIKSIPNSDKLSGEEAFLKAFEQINPDKNLLKEITQVVYETQSTNKGLLTLFEDFARNKHIDLSAIKSKAVICAGFERQVLETKEKLVQELEKLTDESAKKLKQTEIDEFDTAIKNLRKVFYDGTISTAANNNYMQNVIDYKDILRPFLNPDNYKQEIEALPKSNIKQTIEGLGKIFLESGGFKAGDRYGKATANYMACGSFTQHIKDFATSLSNNKAWMRIFGPMTVGLIAITLLVQPLFGKIDNEFPEEKNGGAR